MAVRLYRAIENFQPRCMCTVAGLHVCQVQAQHDIACKQARNSAAWFHIFPKTWTLVVSVQACVTFAIALYARAHLLGQGS